MSKTFLLVGASSAMSVETARLLTQGNHTVIGISRQAIHEPYSQVHNVIDYNFGSLPNLTDPIDGLVYFPGSIRLKPFTRISKEEFLEDYTINVLGAINVLQQYLPLLKKTTSPSVVLISSVAAKTGMPFHTSIASAKAAIEGLSISLAAELAPQVRVNCIAPSLVNTPLAEKFLSTDEKQEAMKKRNPSHKIGSSKELAQLISFLLSDHSSYINGQIISIDGGHSSLRV